MINMTTQHKQSVLTLQFIFKK